MRLYNTKSVTILLELVICVFALLSPAGLTGCTARRPVLIDYESQSTVTSPTGGSAQAEETAFGDNKKISGENTEQKDTQICVFVCGAVCSEGVYYLPAGARVCDAVGAAGGFTGEADTTFVNQAALLADEQKLWIPTRDEAREMSEQSSAGIAEENDGRIDINTADLQQLMQIPGIGEVKAADIIKYREEHGKFGDISEIMNVNGIGEASFNKMEPYITAG